MSPKWSQVYVSPSAEKAIKRLPAREQARIRMAVETLLTEPDHADIKPLTGRPEWRLRVGNWRILFRIDEEARVAVVVAVGSRGDVYK